MVSESEPADDAPTEDPVEALLFECLESDDPAAAVTAAAERHPSLADALRSAYDAVAGLDLVGVHGDAPLPAPRDELPEKLGDYRLLERLGAGGMGVVFLARDDVLQRTVALKLIRPEHVYMPGARERFQREIETIARLQHPGIVPIYGVGKSEGMPYFTMQHIRGSSLSQALTALRELHTPPDGLALARVIASDHPLAESPGSSSGSSTRGVDTMSWPDACVVIAIEVAAALQHAHQRGVLHRDVKPSNILLTAGGRAMLVDFGLAWADGADQRLTHSTSELGSLPYIPPEQIRGEAGDPSRATDVYSLGVTLYEMLTLENPFLGRNAEETRRNILGARALRLRREQRGVSWELETVCMKALDPDPSKRYRTMLDFQRDLERVRDRESIEARRPGALRRARRWSQRHPTLLAALVVGVLVSLIASAGFGVQQRNARVESDQLREVAELERYSALASTADVELRVAGRPERARQLLSQCREQDRGWEWSQLEYATDQSESVATDLQGTVQDLVWHPDGDRYFVCTQALELICRATDQRILWRHDGARIDAFAFRRVEGGEDELITTATGGDLEARSASTGELVARFERPEHAPAGGLTAIELTADGGRAFTTSANGAVCVWDVRARRFVQQLGAHAAQGHCLALSGDGARLATGGFDNTVRVFDTATYEELSTWRMRRWVLGMFFSPDGGTICATDGSALYAKDLRAPEEPPRVLDRDATTVLACTTSPDGQWVALTASRHKLQIYRVSQQAPFRIKSFTTLLGHERLVQHLAFAPDSRRVLSGGSDETVRLWDPQRSAETSARPHRRLVTALAFVGGGACVSGDSFGNLSETDDLGASTPLVDQEGGAAHPGAVRGVLLRDATLTSVDETGRVRTWRRGDDGWEHLSAHETGVAVTCAAHTARGALVLTTAEGDVVVTGEERRTWRAHDAHISALAVYGETAWTACTNGQLRRWDLATGALLTAAPAHPSWIASMVIAPDGDWLATGCADTVIRVHDARTGALRRELAGHARAPMALVTNQDGSRLISGGGFDSELRFWAPSSGRCMLTRGHAEAVLVLAFDPETCSLAFGTRRGELYRLRTRAGGPRRIVARPSPVDRITAPPGQERHR